MEKLGEVGGIEECREEGSGRWKKDGEGEGERERKRERSKRRAGGRRKEKVKKLVGATGFIILFGFISWFFIFFLSTVLVLSIQFLSFFVFASRCLPGFSSTTVFSRSTFSSGP